MTTALNGWPYPAKKLKTFAIPGTNRRITLDAECGPLLVALLSDYHFWLRPIDIGKVDEGGYSDRDGRDAPGRKSNHAIGAAADVNWSEEGAQGSSWGKKFFAQAKAQLALNKIKKIYGPCIQWGGDWRAKDYMHFEMIGSRAAVLAKIKALGIDANGIRHLEANGKPVADVYLRNRGVKVAAPARLWDGIIPTLDQVILAQTQPANDTSWRLACRLADLGFYSGTPKRGQQAYPVNAVKAWQASIGAKPTGIYGPIAHTRIFGA